MKPLPSTRLPGREGGAFAILYAMIFPVMLGMAGLALDLSMMYARRHEMQSVADGAALAAARTLDGTTTGIAAALLAAQNIAVQGQYRFLNPVVVGWSDNALRFGESANGPWLTAAEVGATQAAKMYFTRVDSDRLAAALGKVNISFTRVLGIAAEQHAHAFAVAGRRDSVISPLAICALKPEPVGHRANSSSAAFEEVLEFGFRRGVSYNLLNLNPKASTAINYVFNPVAYHGSTADDLVEAVRPFACTGTAPAAPIESGTTLAVRTPFPASLIGELNSRFSPYPTGTICTEFSAPPDANVYDFRGWYTAPAATSPYTNLYASAMAYNGPVTAGDPLGKLVSVADADSAIVAPDARSYGPLWSFSRPLKYDLAAGAATTVPFTALDWSKLYPVLPVVQPVPPVVPPLPPTVPPATSYAGNLPPYLGAMPPAESAASSFKAVPKNSANLSIVGLPFRRVLNVPLLACPVTDTANATVLGIGRFMMTSKAVAGTSAAIHAEFGGATTYGAMAASAVLYQ